MTHTCPAGSTSLTQDFAAIVYRIQLLGFNAIRLPFSFADLALTPKYLSYSCSQARPSRLTTLPPEPSPGPSLAGSAGSPAHRVSCVCAKHVGQSLLRASPGAACLPSSSLKCLQPPTWGAALGPARWGRRRATAA